LDTLRLENFNLTAKELAATLKTNRFVDEIWLKRCLAVNTTEGFFEMLPTFPSSLKCLGLIECGQLEQSDLASLSLLPNLRVRSFQAFMPQNHRG
jgi:hypothetical protein